MADSPARSSAYLDNDLPPPGGSYNTGFKWWSVTGSDRTSGEAGKSSFRSGFEEIGREAEQAQQLTTDVGTPRYCAPEIIQASIARESLHYGPEVLVDRANPNSNPSPKPDLTLICPKVDVYSFGIVLWEIATQKLPFHSLSFDTQVEQAVLEGKRPTMNPDPVFGGLRWHAHATPWGILMEECWRSDPSARPSMSDVVDRLQRMGPSGTFSVAAPTPERARHSRLDEPPVLTQRPVKMSIEPTSQSRRSQISAIKQSWLWDEEKGKEGVLAISKPGSPGSGNGASDAEKEHSQAEMQALREQLEDESHKLAVAVRAESRLDKRLKECQTEFAQAVEIIQTLALEKARLWEKLEATLRDAAKAKCTKCGGDIQRVRHDSESILDGLNTPPVSPVQTRRAASISVSDMPLPASLAIDPLDAQLDAAAGSPLKPTYSAPETGGIHLVCISPIEQVGWPAVAVHSVAELQAELQSVKPALEALRSEMCAMEAIHKARLKELEEVEQRANDSEQICWDLSNELEAEERKKAAAEDRAQRAEAGMVELRRQLVEAGAGRTESRARNAASRRSMS